LILSRSPPHIYKDAAGGATVTAVPPLLQRLSQPSVRLDEARRLSLSRPRLAGRLRGGRLGGRRCGLAWGHRVGRRFRQCLADESWWHDRSENRATSGLFDFEAIEEGLHIRIRTVCADAAFGCVKEAQKGGGLLGDGLRVSLSVGERFRPQMESAEISSGNHGDRRLLKQEAPTAQSAQGTHLGGLDAQNPKRYARQRNSPGELAQQPPPAKGRLQFAGPINHAPDPAGGPLCQNRGRPQLKQTAS